MNLDKTDIPLELNAEVFSALLSEQSGDYIVKHEGIFSRNYQGDILDINTKNRTLSISRDSLYHLLPQAFFHKIDLFRGISGKNYHDEFKEKWDEQKREKETALNFFAPFDNAVFFLKSEYQKELNKWLSNNSFLTSFILDEEKQENIKNQYIRQSFVFLPYAENIRSNKTKLKWILYWILGDNIKFEKHCFTISYKNTDNNKYNCVLQEENTDSLFCDNEYDDCCFLYLVKVQQNIENINDAYTQEIQLNEFSTFFHRYFMPVYAEFQIQLGDFEKELIINDTSPIFLEYNAQI